MSSLEQPRLHAGDLTMRAWAPTDASAVVTAYEDVEIQRWHARTMTPDEALGWTTSWNERWLSETAASWAIVDSADALLGRVGVQGVNAAEGVASVAYWVVPVARRRQVATRAVLALNDWCMRDMGFHRLQLHHSVHNDGSCGVAQRAGYTLEGTLRGHALHADGWHDMHVHSLVADGRSGHALLGTTSTVVQA